MQTQKFKLVEKDGRELEFETAVSSVFPYAAMKQLAKDNKFRSFSIEIVLA